MNVRELRELLAGLPGEMPVITSGYEGGYTDAHAVVIEAQELSRDPDQDYLGQYEQPAEARRQAALSPDARELAVARLRPPTLVGEPVHALLIYREGR